jgi:predicted transcriptional regulator
MTNTTIRMSEDLKARLSAAAAVSVGWFIGGGPVR